MLMSPYHRTAAPGASKSREFQHHPERRGDHRDRHAPRVQPPRRRERPARRAPISRACIWWSACRHLLPIPHSTCFIQAVEEIAAWPCRRARSTSATLMRELETHPQPPAVARRGPARNRLRHAADVLLARPRGGPGQPRRVDRQPRELRHEPRSAACAATSPGATGRPAPVMDVLEERTKYYIEVATEEPTLITVSAGSARCAR